MAMEELVKYIAQQLVDTPEDVTVTRIDTEDEVKLELRVNPDEMGKIIGKQGRIAKAIRTVVKAAAVKEDKHIRYSVDIV